MHLCTSVVVVQAEPLSRESALANRTPLFSHFEHRRDDAPEIVPKAIERIRTEGHI